MSDGQISFLDAAARGGALLIPLKAAVSQSGIPKPVLKRELTVQKIGRTNYVSVGAVNAYIRRLVTDSGATAPATASSSAPPPEPDL